LRLKRHTRNLNEIQSIVNTAQQNSPKLPVFIQAKPNGLPPKKFPWYTSLGVISFSNTPRLSHLKKLHKQILALAKKRKVGVIGGSSFGFQTTRVYIPASRPGQGTPFLRIAVGCETYLESQSLGMLLVDAL
jgi:hypothetical protein